VQQYSEDNVSELKPWMIEV